MKQSKMKSTMIRHGLLTAASLAALLGTTGAWAQTAVTLTQDGAYNTATVNQNGNYDSDEDGVVDDGGVAEVAEASTAIIQQLGTATSGNENSVTVSQVQAASNTATVTQTAQTTTANSAAVNQSGSAGINIVILKQGFDGTDPATGSGAVAEVYQYGGDADVTNTTTISQSGAGGTVTARQTATSAGTASNSITVTQTAAGVGTTDITQLGFDLSATVTQSSAGTIILDQGGSDNSIGLDQSAAATGSSADIAQTGTGASATITQSAANNDIKLAQAGVDATATIDQNTADNVAYISQAGTENTVDVIQGDWGGAEAGTGNKVSILQAGGAATDGNLATVRQGGNNNNASAAAIDGNEVSYSAGTTFAGVTLTIEQNGIDGVVTLHQNSDSNTAKIYQAATTDTAIASVYQMVANGSTANVAQLGTDLNAVINQ
jgi:hypothetical protein